MSTPIKSSGINGSGATNSGPVANDLMARLNAQSGGNSDQAAFSRWLEKHAILPDKASAPSDAGKTAANAQGALNSPKSPLVNRMTEQAMARARQQAAPQSKPAPTATGQASASASSIAAKAGAASGQGKPVAKPSAGARANETAPKESTEASEDAGSGKDDEVNFSTSMGEGAAVVRELTPPPTIQAGDSAGMMAWLASLTSGHLPQGGAATSGEGNAATDADASTDRGQVGKGDLKADARPGDAKGQGMTLDPRAWQSANATTALQSEALTGGAARAGKEGRVEIDPLAGLNGAQAASFKQTLSDATQGVRQESATLPTPLNSPDFTQALSDQVSLWVSKSVTEGPMTAELHLNPAEMGPINVKISLDGSVAQVDFAAAALETRQAIEASLSTLSAALSDVGLSMTGGDVSSQTAQQQFAQSQQGSAGTPGASGRVGRGMGQGDGSAESDTLSVRQVSVPRSGRLGGLDLYA